MNLSKTKRLFTESYSFDLIFLIKNRFQDEKVRISAKKGLRSLKMPYFCRLASIPIYKISTFSLSTLESLIDAQSQISTQVRKTCTYK